MNTIIFHKFLAPCDCNRCQNDLQVVAAFRHVPSMPHLNQAIYNRARSIQPQRCLLSLMGGIEFNGGSVTFSLISNAELYHLTNLYEAYVNARGQDSKCLSYLLRSEITNLAAKYIGATGDISSDSFATVWYGNS